MQQLVRWWEGLKLSDKLAVIAIVISLIDLLT